MDYSFLPLEARYIKMGLYSDHGIPGNASCVRAADWTKKI